MPLIPCPTCGKNVSRDANSCPHCGDPLTDNFGWLAGLIIVFVGFPVGAVIILWWMGFFHGNM